jgi:hypothetical protein
MSSLQVDPRAMREELGLEPRAELGSHRFLRFVNRLCEALDRDIPREEWDQLLTLEDCLAWLRAHHPDRLMARVH